MSIQEMFEGKWNPNPNNEPPDFFDRLWRLLFGILFVYLVVHGILLYGFDINSIYEIPVLYNSIRSFFQ